MCGTFVYADQWLPKVARKFNMGHPGRMLHFDLLPVWARGCDLISDIAKAAGCKDQSELWSTTRQSTQLRLASLPASPEGGGLRMMLNVWPTEDVSAQVAAILGLQAPAPGRDWAFGLPQLVVALARTGFTSASGLLANPGYQGDGARKGMMYTMWRLVVVPRCGGGPPLLVLAATNGGEGMNYGSCHAPAAAVTRGETAMDTAHNWSVIVDAAAGFLSSRLQVSCVCVCCIVCPEPNPEPPKH